MILLSMGLLLLDLMFTLAADKPVPRRDAEYPPPSALEGAIDMHRECVAETGVTEAAIRRFSDEDIFEDDENLKCYMNCLFHKSNLTDDKGELHLGKMMEVIPKEYENIALKMGIKCTKPKGKSLCERAFWFHKCWKTADPVHYFLL
ncbi:general odorant-binding protein 83a-like [Sabethes cyaneus]|uniref:general odorant-binding protein 83a-like n=1 Tax=Sabethes cyaneus TaxID=53552 RepID=UPI00237DCFC0|nr:general odorant-binding protein 83a-like [Sabethes cyaneus]